MRVVINLTVFMMLLSVISGFAPRTQYAEVRRRAPHLMKASSSSDDVPKKKIVPKIGDILRRNAFSITQRDAVQGKKLTYPGKMEGLKKSRGRLSFGALIVGLSLGRPAFASTQILARTRWIPKCMSLLLAYLAVSMRNAGPNPGRQGKIGIKCPWPFVMFHDPMVGLRDWPTWALLSVLLWAYN